LRETIVPFVDLLRQLGVAPAVVNQVWMPTITQLAEKLHAQTADFAYIRRIGNWKGIEKKRRPEAKSPSTANPKAQAWVRRVSSSIGADNDSGSAFISMQ
jgi:hypothetical protein